MRQNELSVLLKNAKDEVARLESIKVCCAECKHAKIDRVMGIPECGLFDEFPPPEVQATGCQEWEWDEIVF